MLNEKPTLPFVILFAILNDRKECLDSLGSGFTTNPTKPNIALRDYRNLSVT